MKRDLKILVRGAGDIASGIIWSLAYAGFNVCCTEVEKPSTIRTEVAFSSAIYDGKKILGGVECVLCEGSHSSPVRTVGASYMSAKEGSHSSPVRTVGASYTSAKQIITNDIYKCWEEKKVALIIDQDAKILDEIKFDVVVDAILAKKNLGTKIDMAPFVIGVGPGFTTNVDCHIAIETMRGHNLARIIVDGSPMKNTGVPGLIAGHSSDRVIHSPATGIIHNIHKIGDTVKKDEVIAVIDEGSHSLPVQEGSHSSPVRTVGASCTSAKKGSQSSPVQEGSHSSPVQTVGASYTSAKKGSQQDGVKVCASIDGILRGIIRDGYNVTAGLKIADIDPRLTEYENCFTISDKARSIGGAVVTAIMHNFNS